MEKLEVIDAFGEVFKENPVGMRGRGTDAQNQ